MNVPSSNPFPSVDATRPQLSLSATSNVNSDVTRAEQSFGKILSDTISQTNDMQLQGDAAVRQLNAGESKNLHEAMIAMEEADISLRFLVQVRNKAMDAYQEIMRMQV